MRLSDTEYELMRMVIEDRVQCGYEMAKRGVPKGTVYVLLGRLEDKDMLHGEYRVNGDAMPRKEYTATSHGLDVFRLWRSLKALA